MFPISYLLVAKVFCRHLLEALGVEPELAVISDRDKSIHKTVKDLSSCTPLLLSANILPRTPSKSVLEARVNKLMDEMLTRHQGQKCYDWVQGWPPKHWALHAVRSDFPRFGHQRPDSRHTLVTSGSNVEGAMVLHGAPDW